MLMAALHPLHAETAQLVFFAGGSITGDDYSVRIAADGHVRFRQAGRGGSQVVREFERMLTVAEQRQLTATLRQGRLIRLPSQDFLKEPLLPDQGSYHIELDFLGLHHAVNCGLPRGDRALSRCQRAIAPLRNLLNTLLGVRIY
ncbi:MAG: hypothetical protein HY696_09410 [Deltaproteobacteria bacterium]|nr:hypothetical protein [Deltaproteobacteria bacterium]